MDELTTPGAPAAPGDRTDPRGRPSRLFVGVWPPPEVVAALSLLERPVLAGVRWASPAQWHVTLAFLGAVDPSRLEEIPAVLELATARVAGPVVARLGAATRRLGRSVLCVPVQGLDGLAGEVRRELGALLSVGDLGSPFCGHLTLARGRGRRPVPAFLEGSPVEAAWQVHDVALVRSEPGPSGSVYTTLTTATVPHRPR